MGSSTETANLMDGVYQNQRHIYDITRKFYLLGRDLLIERLDVKEGGRVLELGCGTGRNLISAAKRYPKACFSGVDISEEMLSTARRNIDRAGLADRVSVVRHDASDPLLGEILGGAPFDRVFYSYTLSMMPIWKEALTCGMAQLSDEGRLSVIDFGQQEGLPGIFKHALFAWLRSFHVTPRNELFPTLSELAASRSWNHTFVPLYRGYAHYAELAKRSADLYSPATK
ncbi:MAG: methyltransferase domain-containing protein [Rhodobacteraceae bacterium]|nr:methyltransferase domain-containing protein [Paracoccaceae bacterium]